MNRLIFSIFVLTASAVTALAAERPMRFWNLTLHTITEFYLAPAGTTNWGSDQCKNDKDGTVDSDERLRITDTPEYTTQNSWTRPSEPALFAI